MQRPPAAPAATGAGKAGAPGPTVGGGLGCLADGTPISPALAHRLACDCDLIPAVLGTDGAVLDLGRTHRLFTGATRRALALRDRGCAFPGCDRPPEWCDAHHVLDWYHGGPTCLGNGVLLCGHHHTVVHRDGWRISYAPDGIPEFTAPTWLDPTGTPQRNHRHPPCAGSHPPRPPAQRTHGAATGSAPQGRSTATLVATNGYRPFRDSRRPIRSARDPIRIHGCGNARCRRPRG